MKTSFLVILMNVAVLTNFFDRYSGYLTLNKSKVFMALEMVEYSGKSPDKFDKNLDKREQKRTQENKREQENTKKKDETNKRPATEKEVIIKRTEKMQIKRELVMYCSNHNPKHSGTEAERPFLVKTYRCTGFK